jgi:tetratricopeptide (TPR) repeat protein
MTWTAAERDRVAQKKENDDRLATRKTAFEEAKAEGIRAAKENRLEDAKNSFSRALGFIEGHPERDVLALVAVKYQEEVARNLEFFKVGRAALDKAPDGWDDRRPPDPIITSHRKALAIYRMDGVIRAELSPELFSAAQANETRALLRELLLHQAQREAFVERNGTPTPKYISALRLLAEVDTLTGSSSVETTFLKDMWEGKRQKSFVVSEAEEALKDSKLAGSYHANLAVGSFLLLSSDDGDRKQALTYLRRAEEIDPNQFEPHLQILRLATRRDRRIPELMRAEAEVCLAMRPDLAVTWMWAGFARLQYDTTDPNKLNTCLRIFEKSASLDPLRDDAHLFLGIANYEIKRYETSEKAFDRVLALEISVPEVSGEARACRALVRVTLGKWRPAYEDYETARKDRFISGRSEIEFNFACTASLLAKNISRDPGVPDERRAKMVRDLKAKAIDHLRQAIRLGYNTPDRYKMMREDTDLDFVRAEPAFQKLVPEK